jgi:hypothetical protein
MLDAGNPPDNWVDLIAAVETAAVPAPRRSDKKSQKAKKAGS